MLHQVKLDPRLRKVFGVSQSEANTSTLASPPADTPPLGNIIAAPVVAPSDPRRRNSNSSMTRRVDPRQARGASAAAANCPPTPRMDEFDEPPVTDTDLRSQFGRQAPWDNGSHRGRGGLLPHPNDGNNWMPNAPSSFGHASHMPPHSYQHQRSYTPPPT